MTALLIILPILLLLSLFGCAGRIKLLRWRKRKLHSEIDGLGQWLKERKQLAIIELDQWVKQERVDLQESLTAENEERKQFLDREIKVSRRQTLAGVEADIAEQKREAGVRLTAWKEQEKARIQQHLEREHADLQRSMEAEVAAIRTTKMSQLEAEVAAIRTTRMSQEEAEFTEKKQIGIIKLDDWLQQERRRLQQQCDRDRDTLKQALETELATIREQKLAQMEIERVAPK